MKHDHGISVRILGAAGELLDEYVNQDVRRDPAFKGDLRSSVIASKPGETFQVQLCFDPGFQQYSADGVMVVIACGHGLNPPGGFHHVQAHWITGGAELATHRFDFYSTSTWVSEEASPEEVDLQMPLPLDPADRPDFDTSWQSACTAPPGSITIFVQRGRLPQYDSSTRRELKNVIHNNRFAQLERQIPEPPDSYRGRHPFESPLVIDRWWFSELVGKNGLTYAFEYRNVGTENVDLAQLQIIEQPSLHDDLMTSTELFKAGLDLDAGDGDDEYLPDSHNITIAGKATHQPSPLVANSRDHSMDRDGGDDDEGTMPHPPQELPGGSAQTTTIRSAAATPAPAVGVSVPPANIDSQGGKEQDHQSRAGVHDQNTGVAQVGGGEATAAHARSDEDSQPEVMVIEDEDDDEELRDRLQENQLKQEEIRIRRRLRSLEKRGG